MIKTSSTHALIYHQTRSSYPSYFRSEQSNRLLLKVDTKGPHMADLNDNAP